MLVTTRKTGEKIYVGDAVITVLACRRGRVRLGVECPRDVPVHRAEARHPAPGPHPPAGPR